MVYEIVTGLIAQDGDRVASGLGQLRSEHPAHPDLPSLTLLADALHAPAPETATDVTLTACVEELERRVAPAARRFLGAAATGFLRPWWHTLALTAATLPFDGAHPCAHRGWLCQQYGDWVAVRAAVEAEHDWPGTALLRYWMGLARHHLGEVETAVRHWLPLCWVDPVLFARHAPELPSAPVRDAWNAFERSALLDDVPAETRSHVAWFPAWLLVRHPGLTNLFRGEEVPTRAPPRGPFACCSPCCPWSVRGSLKKWAASVGSCAASAPASFVTTWRW